MTYTVDGLLNDLAAEQRPWHDSRQRHHVSAVSPEHGIKLLGLLLAGSTGQHMAGRNGLA